MSRVQDICSAVATSLWIAHLRDGDHQQRREAMQAAVTELVHQELLDSKLAALCFVRAVRLMRRIEGPAQAL